MHYIYILSGNETNLSLVKLHLENFMPKILEIFSFFAEIFMFSNANYILHSNILPSFNTVLQLQKRLDVYLIQQDSIIKCATMNKQYQI